MQLLRQIAFSRRFKKYVSGFLILIILYTLTGFLVLPHVVESVLTDKLSQLLKRTVTIENVKANPYVLSLRIMGLNIQDKDGERFISLDDFFINLQLSSLFKGAAVIHQLQVVRPYLRIVRTGKATFNFSDMDDGSGKGDPNALPGFLVRNIRVTGGKVLFQDSVVDRRHELADISLSLPALSSLPGYVDMDAQPVFTARLNDASLSISGRIRPFARNRRALLQVNVRRFDMVPELVYLPVRLRARIQSAIAQVDTTVTYDEAAGGDPRVSVSGPVTLNKLSIADKAGDPLIELPEFTMVMAPSNLLSGEVHLSAITWRALALGISRDQSGRFNLEDLIPERDASSITENERGEAAAPFNLIVDKVRVDPARLVFSDHSVEGPFSTTLEPVKLSLDHFSFSLQGEVESAYTLSFQTETGETVNLSGNLSSGPVQTEGKVELAGFDPRKYSPYFKDKVNFDVTEGTIDVASAFRIEIGKGDPLLRLTDTSISIDALKLTDRDTQKSLLSIPVLTVERLSFDMSERSVKLGRLVTEKGYAFYQRSRDGRVNLQNLIADNTPPGVAKSMEGKADAAKPWQLDAEEIKISDCAVGYEDLSLQEPVRLDLDRITVLAAPFSTATNQKSTISIATRWNQKGRISAQGEMAVNPGAADLHIKVEDVDIRSFQPYVSQQLNAVVTAGEVNCEGKVDFKFDKAGKPSFVYKGLASIVRFASVDKAYTRDFARWDSLYLSHMTVGLNPTQLLVEKMALNKYYTRIIILPDGAINFNRVIARNRSKAAPVSENPVEPAVGVGKPPMPVVNIKHITIQDSAFQFTDLLNKPNFEADIQQLGGHIVGLSSEKGAVADLFLKGVSENTAPIEITGRFNPFGEDRLVDLKLLFKDIELSPFSAYSGKYLGYLVQKGKLHLNLEYKMLANKLNAKNLVVLDQLTLGDKVESPDATSLPVAFAISLLKDRSGRIEIDLPITGDVKDPEFKIGKIIVKMIVNLFTKVITSPFAALGAAFGGGEQLSHVDFNPGSPEVPEAGKKTLDTLIKALYERPALQLEIKGEVNPATDGDALRKIRFNDQLKAEKLNLMTEAGQKAVPLGEVEIAEAEQDLLVSRVYQAAEFPKPRNPSGKIKVLPLEEIEKLLLTKIQVTKGDLRLLAHERASMVKDYLIKSEKIDPAKVFVIEPDADFGQESKSHQNSRTHFTLK